MAFLNLVIFTILQKHQIADLVCETIRSVQFITFCKDNITSHQQDFKEPVYCKYEEHKNCDLGHASVVE